MNNTKLTTDGIVDKVREYLNANNLTSVSTKDIDGWLEEQGYTHGQISGALHRASKLGKLTNNGGNYSISKDAKLSPLNQLSSNIVDVITKAQNSPIGEYKIMTQDDKDTFDQLVEDLIQLLDKE